MRKIRYTRRRYEIYRAVVTVVGLGWWVVVFIVPAPYARGLAMATGALLIGTWARNNYGKFFKQ